MNTLNDQYNVLKMGPIPASFLYFRLFITVDRKYTIKILADDWIRTVDLRSQN